MYRSIEKIIEEVKHTIVKGADPDMVVLFGSHASGDMHADSDLDILVVKESDLRFDERALEIYDLFEQISYPIDIVVYTPKEVKEYKEVKNSFLYQVLKGGKILYKQ